MTTMRSLSRLLCVALLAPTAWGYIVDTGKSGIYVMTWVPGTISMEVKLPVAPALQDGTNSNYASSVQAAMQAWNSLLGTVQFTSQVIATSMNPPAGTYSTSSTDSHNEIVMDRTYDGLTFDSQTLAITTTFTHGNTRYESDMVFNTAWTWNSYRGNLQSGKVMDIRRVAIHELGHVLGLDHPDNPFQPPAPAPQKTPQPNMVAIMNSYISDLDTMQADDIAGARLLYGAPGFVPSNNDFTNATNITLSNGAFSTTGTNIGGTKQPGEPIHAGADAPSGHSVWWKWTAPGSGNATIDTLGSNFDTVLAVYTGASVSALNFIASNDDAEPLVQGVDNPVRKRSSAVTFNAVGGTTYSIAVDGWGSISEGDPSTYFGTIALNLNYAGPVNVAPAFTTQPASQTIAAGNSVTFTVAASGTPAPTYQWQKGGVNIGGATGSSFTIPSVVPGDVGSYTVVATNSSGSVTSNAASLAVIIAPGSAVISIIVE